MKIRRYDETLGGMEESATGQWMRWEDVLEMWMHIEKRYGIVIEYRVNTTPAPAALAPALDTTARASRAPGRDEPLRQQILEWAADVERCAEGAHFGINAVIQEMRAAADRMCETSGVNPASSSAKRE